MEYSRITQKPKETTTTTTFNVGRQRDRNDFLCANQSLREHLNMRLCVDSTLLKRISPTAE